MDYKKLADPQCNICEGTGERNVPQGEDDFDIEYCDCVEKAYELQSQT